MDGFDRSWTKMAIDSFTYICFEFNPYNYKNMKKFKFVIALIVFLELFFYMINSDAWLYADGVYSCRNETYPWRLVENDSPHQVRISLMYI